MTATNMNNSDDITNVECQVIENPYYGGIDDAMDINEQCQVIQNPYIGEIDDRCIVYDGCERCKK